jgi:hypothetical protein
VRPFPPLPSTVVALVTERPAPADVVTTDHEGLAGWPRCWPGVLPHHRDVIAAHLAARLAVDGRALGRVLPMLAEADGPAGPGLSLALAYGLGAGQPIDRTGAADALLLLAGRAQLDGAAVGEYVGQLVQLSVFPLTRVVPVLGEVLAAGVDVWPLVSSALRVLLAAPRPANRLADLLVLGYEARRLHALLQDPTHR